MKGQEWIRNTNKNILGEGRIYIRCVNGRV